MLEMASRIHSAKGGVRASQARDDEAADLTDAACVSDAILVSIAHRRVERMEKLKYFALILAADRDNWLSYLVIYGVFIEKLRKLRKYLAISCY